MFTGIVSAIGNITEVCPFGDGYRLSIDANQFDLIDVVLGDSIAINGACMTVVDIDLVNTVFKIDISAESISKTAGLSKTGPVNLEKALRLQDRLGGHLVSGHVDGIGHIYQFSPVTSDLDSSWHLVIRAPITLAKYFAYKGSVVVNGASLTINQVDDISGKDDCRIHINIIPHTLQCTTLAELKIGDSVNLEVDLIARYVERMLSYQVLQSTNPIP